jgi:hypothetical protein
VTIYTYFLGSRTKITPQECPEEKSLGGHGCKLFAPHCTSRILLSLKLFEDVIMTIFYDLIFSFGGDEFG